MARTSEFDQSPLNKPDITMEMMPAYIDPIKTRPDLTRYGESVDQLKAEEEARLHREELLGHAQKNIFTDITGWGSGLVSGVTYGSIYGTAGAALGLTSGFIVASAFSGIGELIGIPVSDAVRGITSQDLIQYGNGAVEQVSGVASYMLPDKVTDGLAWALNNIQTQIITGIGGISFAGYFGGKGWTEGYPKGNSFGRNVGTTVSYPVVTLVDKLPFDMPKMPSFHVRDFLRRITRRNKVSEQLEI